jgi:hypothetical protein
MLLVPDILQFAACVCLLANDPELARSERYTKPTEIPCIF